MIACLVGILKVFLLTFGLMSIALAQENTRDQPLVAELPGARFFGQEGLKPQRWMLPLNRVKWVPAENAGGFMRDEDPVVAVVDDGQAWAIPWWILKNHHVANLTLNGRSRLITFCELCSSASGFYSTLDNKELSFFLVGAYQGSILIRDRQSGSLWAPFLGKGLSGRYKDRRLERFQVLQSRWSDWLAKYPHTLVSKGHAVMRLGHNKETAPGDDRPIGSVMESSIVAKPDRRLPDNRLVLGVETTSGGKAYALDQLGLRGVLPDSLDNERIVIFSVPGTLMASAFRPVVDNRELTFCSDGNGGFRDLETHSYWDISGAAVVGPLAGKRLPYLPSGTEEWYIWSNYNPDTELWLGATDDLQSPDQLRFRCG